MIVNYDIESFEEFLALSRQAYSSIETSVEYSDKVIKHDNWGCPERQDIIEKIEACQKAQKQLMEEVDGFINSMVNVKSKLCDIENQLKTIMLGMEGVFAGSLAIGSENITLTSADTEITEVVKSIDGSLLEKYSANSLNDPISVCNFNDINLGESR
ncbi:MAG: hypothetical protein ACI39R_06825 [Lachnospiraceae bacterium]